MSCPPALQCGLDIGTVAADIRATSGRVAYLGKVMSRASDIAARAQTGELPTDPIADPIADQTSPMPHMWRNENSQSTVAPWIRSHMDIFFLPLCLLAGLPYAYYQQLLPPAWPLQDLKHE